MKKICEIYDISQEYEKKENTILVIVSDVESEMLFEKLPELRPHSDRFFTYDDWQQYLEINKLFNRNNAKHHMREIRGSKKLEANTLKSYETNEVSEILENSELKSKVDKALSTLKEVPRRRFLKHYVQHLTIREIAAAENRAASSIYESIVMAREKFLKNFA